MGRDGTVPDGIIDVCAGDGGLEGIKATKSGIEVAVVVRILAMLSVEGQRSLPSLEKRLLLLNVVGSSPARRASPDVE